MECTFRIHSSSMSLTNEFRFLWVVFQIAELCEAMTDAEIRQTLRTLPKGLAATYRRILEKISQSTGGAAKVAIAQKMFKWIICARRPLQIDELKEAVGIDSTDTFWDTDKIATDGMRLIQCCGNLIVFDKNDKTVRLAHKTVQQFLLSEPAYSMELSKFHFQLQQANLEVGEIC